MAKCKAKPKVTGAAKIKMPAISVKGEARTWKWNPWESVVNQDPRVLPHIIEEIRSYGYTGKLSPRADILLFDFNEMLVALRITDVKAATPLVLLLPMVKAALKKTHSSRPTADEPSDCDRGDGVIVIDGDTPSVIIDGHAITITDAEDCVLRTFLESPALDSRMLKQKSGYDDADRTLRRLANRYGGKLSPFITFPGRKGKGGYSVKIRLR